MSQTQTQAVLPDAQTAFDNLFYGVAQRVFFNKCAAAGYVPSTEAQARAMLEDAGKLRVLGGQQSVKQAAEANDPFLKTSRALDGLMEQYGLGQAHADEELAMKQAAEDAASDPVLYNSVLALKAAEAAEFQTQYQQYQAQQAQRAA